MQKCGPRSAVASLGSVSASIRHEINRWEIPSAIRPHVVPSVCSPRKKTHRSPPIRRNSPWVFRDLTLLINTQASRMSFDKPSRLRIAHIVTAKQEVRSARSSSRR